jgi:hypothetical protein
MEDKEKIDVLIERLRQHQPQLRDGKTVTDNIMDKINVSKHKRIPRFLSYIQTFSGVAAVLLGILFVVQFYQDAEKNTNTNISQPPKIAKTANPCYENLKNEDYSLTDLYLCYSQQDTERNKHLENLKNKYN